MFESCCQIRYVVFGRNLSTACEKHDCLSVVNDEFARTRLGVSLSYFIQVLILSVPPTQAMFNTIDQLTQLSWHNLLLTNRPLQ